jgi:hypothetical protein
VLTQWVRRPSPGRKICGLVRLRSINATVPPDRPVAAKDPYISEPKAMDGVDEVSLVAGTPVAGHDQGEQGSDDGDPGVGQGVAICS